MQFKFSLIVLVLCFILTSECKEVNVKTETITIYCDHFPSLKIDSVIMDTSLFKVFVKENLEKSINDSILFLIECSENTVIEDVLKTEMILKHQINQISGSKIKFRIYNKCLADLSPPSTKANRIKTNLVLKADKRGNLFLNDTLITLDGFCQKFKSQKITIKINADEALSAEKLISILEKLNKEGFVVSM